MSEERSLGLDQILSQSRHAVILGVGGGGDIVGTVPTARLLEAFGVSSILGGLSWERFVYDPQPGTRSLAEVTQVQALSPAVWVANAETATTSGVRFAESEVARFYGRDTLLVDLSLGVSGVVDGLKAAMAALDADLLIGVDVGGDSLGRGDEAGLRSPLADAMMLAAIAALGEECRVLWGVIGYGSDGELTPAEIDVRIAEVAGRGGLFGAWGVTPAVADEMQRLISHVRTEASDVVVRAARGAVGAHGIRDGTREVAISPHCTVTYYLDPGALTACTPLAAAVVECESLAAASDVITAMGIHSEYAFELEMQRRGIDRYSDER